jgi:hypothetical protein
MYSFTWVSLGWTEYKPQQEYLKKKQLSMPNISQTKDEIRLCLTLWSRSSPKFYIIIQSVPQRKHSTSPLQRWHWFTLRTTRNTELKNNADLLIVKARGTYSYSYSYATRLWRISSYSVISHKLIWKIRGALRSKAGSYIMNMFVSVQIT